LYERSPSWLAVKSALIAAGSVSAASLPLATPEATQSKSEIKIKDVKQSKM
jgi:hypothetical protein